MSGSWQPNPPPYGQQPGGYQQGYPPPPPQQAGTNGFSIASLVLGILWLYGIGSILALVFGYMAKQQIRQRGQGGNGLATAGIVLGWVGVAGLILLIILAIVVANSDDLSLGALA